MSKNSDFIQSLRARVQHSIDFSKARNNVSSTQELEDKGYNNNDHGYSREAGRLGAFEDVLAMVEEYLTRPVHFRDALQEAANEAGYGLYACEEHKRKEEGKLLVSVTLICLHDCATAETHGYSLDRISAKFPEKKIIFTVRGPNHV